MVLSRINDRFVCVPLHIGTAYFFFLPLEPEKGKKVILEKSLLCLDPDPHSVFILDPHALL